MKEIYSITSLRIDISSSNFPAYNNHLNNTGIWSMDEEEIIANKMVYTGNVKASYIELPIKTNFNIRI